MVKAFIESRNKAVCGEWCRAKSEDNEEDQDGGEGTSFETHVNA